MYTVYNTLYTVYALNLKYFNLMHTQYTIHWIKVKLMYCTMYKCTEHIYIYIYIYTYIYIYIYIYNIYIYILIKLTVILKQQ